MPAPMILTAEAVMGAGSRLREAYSGVHSVHGDMTPPEGRGPGVPVANLGVTFYRDCPPEVRKDAAITLAEDLAAAGWITPDDAAVIAAAVMAETASWFDVTLDYPDDPLVSEPQPDVLLRLTFSDVEDPMPPLVTAEPEAEVKAGTEPDVTFHVADGTAIPRRRASGARSLQVDRQDAQAALMVAQGRLGVLLGLMAASEVHGDDVFWAFADVDEALGRARSLLFTR